MTTPTDNTRDALAEAIHSAICEESLEEHLDPDWPGRCVKAADAVLALLQPHTIDSVEELDALPHLSVVLDSGGFPRQIDAHNDPAPSEWIDLPATLLWSPEEAGQ